MTEGYYSNIPYGFFPAGRGDGRDCGFLPSSLIKQATGVPPFTLLMEEVGRGQDAGGAGWHRVTACSSPQGRTHRVGHTTQKTKARVEEGEGTPNVPSGRRKSPVMKAVLVQANIRQVPAHVRLTNDRVGLTDPGTISAEILTQME